MLVSLIQSMDFITNTWKLSSWWSSIWKWRSSCITISKKYRKFANTGFRCSVFVRISELCWYELCSSELFSSNSTLELFEYLCRSLVHLRFFSAPDEEVTRSQIHIVLASRCTGPRILIQRPGRFPFAYNLLRFDLCDELPHCWKT